MPIPIKTRFLFVAANADFVRLFLRDQILALLADGSEVLVVCAPENGEGLLQRELGCTVRSLDLARSITPGADLKSLLRLYHIIRQWRPEIVHSHSPKAGLLGSLAALLARVPVRIHTFHGLRSETLTGTRQAVVQSMERLTADCNTECLAVSASLRAELVRRDICNMAKVRVLGSGSCAGVDLDHFNPAYGSHAGANFRMTHEITPQAFVITYVGRIAQDKGVATLEEAWQTLRIQHPTARLLIAGPLDSADPCSHEVLNNFRQDDRVIFLERFIEDVAPLLAATDVFVQPSCREGLGVAALEASAMKVPVVASRVTGLVDAVEPGQTGLLVKAGSATALAEAVTQLIRLPRMRTYMGERGRDFVKCRFDRRLVQAHLRRYYAERKAGIVPRQPVSKRLFDLVLTSLLIIIALPVCLVVAVAIKLSMGGPVLFTQARAGLGGKAFKLLKFRTMRAPLPGEVQFATDAIRTSALGDLLRRFSLDELPQLWNVLSGDMSLIGPRPLLLDYLPRYNATQRHRHDVLPGITGWAQIHGRNDLDWHERFAHDVWYVEHRSMLLDLHILCETLFKFLRPQGIVPQGKTAMTEFRGTPSAQ